LIGTTERLTPTTPTFHPASMDKNPLDIALQHIIETQSLLESLITSSESFNYPKAKVALRQLQKKTRELAKAQGKLAKVKRQEPAASNIKVVNFQVSNAAND
jgi:hypothetical protein